jgi:hypothetical protein
VNCKVPKKDHSNVINGLIGIACLVAFVVIVWFVAFAQGERLGQKDVLLQQVWKSADIQIKENCVKLDVVGLQDCVKEKLRNSLDQQRAESIAFAQTAAVDWAFWTMAATLFGSVVSGIGIYFVRKNLIEMQKQREVSEKAVAAAHQANLIQKELGQAQTRAYLFAQDAHIVLNSHGKWECQLSLSIAGPTPAANLEYRYSVGPDNHFGLITIDLGLAEIDTLAPHKFTGAMRPSDSFHTVTLDHDNLDAAFKDNTGSKRLMILGRLDYEDVFQKRLYSDFAFATNSIFDGTNQKLKRIAKDLDICRLRLP